MRSPALAVTETSERSFRAETLPERSRQVPLIAKHPVSMSKPEAKVEVAVELELMAPLKLVSHVEV